MKRHATRLVTGLLFLGAMSVVAACGLWVGQHAPWAFLLVLGLLTAYWFGAAVDSTRRWP